MAENVVLNAGSGGSTCAADEIAAIHYQRVKLIHGIDGTNDGDVATTNPFPVNVQEVAGTTIPTGGGVEASAVRVTIASDSTGVVTVDGTVTVTDIAAIKTAVEILDNAISGTEMQVDVVAPLPAGTNAIGTLAANSGVDIGDVDVTSVVPGVAATNLGKQEDAAHTTGDVGVMPLAVRNDVLAALSDTDGDYAPIQVNATGAVFVQEGAAMDVSAATVTVDGSGVTQPVSGTLTVTDVAAIKTAVELIDNAISGTEMQVDVVAPLPAGTNAIGKLAANTGVDIGDVDVLTLPDVAQATAANLNCTEASAASIATAVELIDNAVYVDDADFTADTSSLMLAGAVRDDVVDATEVTTEGDVTALRCNKFGQLKTTDLADATSEIKYAVIDDAVSGDNTLVAAAGLNTKIRVLSLFLVSAGTVNATFESSVAGPSLTGAINLIANTGFVLPYNPGGWFETADNALLNMILSAAISVDGSLSYVEVGAP